MNNQEYKDNKSGKKLDGDKFSIKQAMFEYRVRYGYGKNTNSYLANPV